MGTLKTEPLFEQWHNGGFLVSESNGHLSREQALLSGGVKILAGTVLGLQTAHVSIGGAGGENSGNGTVDLITQVGAQLGNYTVKLTSTTAFSVTSPSGIIMPAGFVGVAYSQAGVNFTITAGTTAFSTVDSFYITLSNEYVPLSLTATDGSKTAAAISFATVDVTAMAKESTIVVRQCEVNAGELVWPIGFTSDLIAAATAQLALQNIILR